jgi:hypothetical protein
MTLEITHQFLNLINNLPSAKPQIISVAIVTPGQCSKKKSQILVKSYTGYYLFIFYSTLLWPA